MYNNVYNLFQELKWQAAIILGSTDFLGNPLGFVNDLSEGMSGLIELRVGDFLKNVTHGVSNSAAKVSGKLPNCILKTCPVKAIP